MTIKIQFGGETMFFENALIAGELTEGHPSSCYIGSIDPDQIHSALYFSHRAIIRLLVDQFDVPFDEVDSFLLSALSEALTKEYNNRMKGESDMEVRASLKFKRNHK